MVKEMAKHHLIAWDVEEISATRYEYKTKKDQPAPK